MKTLIRICALGLFLVAGTASAAYQFRIAEFEIERGGVSFFRDTFSDGSPPPNTPAQGPGMSTATYGVQGTLGPENLGGNDKLILDQSGAVFNTGFFGTTPNVSQRATLNTNTDSANTTNGLKRNFAFTVVGAFDLIAPALGESYGVRLSDEVGGLGSDIIDLRVRNVSGTPIIQFRETDEVGTTQVLFELPLDLGHEQIILALDHPNPNTDTIFGRYLYVDGGVDGPLNSFVPTFDIFNGELFTRAAFNANALVSAIPEPTTLALLGFGLIGFLGRSRRRAQH